MHPKHIQDKHQLQAVWFAAGTAVVIACVERAVVVSIFQQWRMWVFLALNLLLIAILFTSTHAPPKSQETDKKHPPAEATHRDDVVDDGVNVLQDLNITDDEIGDGEVEDEEADDDEKLSGLLTNEELNERVEAFISRFRQQYLVSDVKISRSSSYDSVCERVVLSKTATV